MQLTASVTAESLAYFKDVFDRIEQFPLVYGPIVRDHVIGEAYAVILDAFESEGIGADRWHELAAYTVYERLRLGFPGEHPILVRTGALRASLTDETSLALEERRAGDCSATIGTSDPRFIWHQEGTPNMPARPMWPVEGSAYERAFLESIERLVAELIGEHGA